jgi:hypothetical protein
MRKGFILIGALLCLSLSASAQDAAETLDSSSSAAEPAAPSPASLYPSARDPWQFGAGFQYLHFNLLGQNFHDIGFNTQVTRYLDDWFGVEGTGVFGYGHTGSKNLVAKSLFVGGGPHISFSNSTRFEPWAHVLVGWQHFRFTQVNAGFGSDSAIAFMGGGGLDIKFGGRAAWRVQGDFIGSHFGNTIQKNDYSFGTGIVFNF